MFRVRERHHVASLHQEIVDAVRERNDAKAAAALARLLAYVRESYSAVLEARARRNADASQAS
ncbi:hypothetical protein D3C87_2067440 [compost metagenome]